MCELMGDDDRKQVLHRPVCVGGSILQAVVQHVRDASAAFRGNDGCSNRAGRPGSARHHAAAQDDNREVLQSVVLAIDVLSTAGTKRRSPVDRHVNRRIETGGESLRLGEDVGGNACVVVGAHADRVARFSS